MNNFNSNLAGTGNRNSDQLRPASNVSPGSRSLFGFREFSSNDEAHSFVNSALNRGNGFHGGIAAAFEIPNPSPSRANRLNGTRLDGDLPGQLNAPVLSPMQGYFGAMNPIGLHPHPLQNEVLPPPDSVMFVLASVDEPSVSSGQRRQSQSQQGSGNGSTLVGGLDGNFSRNLDSPLSSLSSNVSVASSHSHSSLSSHHSSASSQSHSSLSSHHSSASSQNSGARCSCEACRKCVCHLYCSHHAQKKCPVHGLGLNSSAESNASYSPVHGLSGNGNSGTPSRSPSNVSESSSHSADSWGSFDSEFGESPVHSESCRCDICQFCICNAGGMFTNCVARCAKHGMVRLY